MTSRLDKTFERAIKATKKGGSPSWWTAQHDRAYSALQKAAERIARGEYKAGRYRPMRWRGKVVRGYTITEDHEKVVQAMADLGRNKISPEEAMAILHEYGVFKARLKDNPGHPRKPPKALLERAVKAMQLYAGSQGLVRVRDEQRLYDRARKLIDQVAQKTGLELMDAWTQIETEARKRGFKRAMPGKDI